VKGETDQKWEGWGKEGKLGLGGAHRRRRSLLYARGKGRLGEKFFVEHIQEKDLKKGALDGRLHRTNKSIEEADQQKKNKEKRSKLFSGTYKNEAMRILSLGSSPNKSPLRGGGTDT